MTPSEPDEAFPPLHGLLLEEVLRKLDLKNRLSASSACREWDPTYLCFNFYHKETAIYTSRPAKILRFAADGDVWNLAKWMTCVGLSWSLHNASSEKLLQNLPDAWFRPLKMLRIQAGDGFDMDDTADQLLSKVAGLDQLFLYGDLNLHLSLEQMLLAHVANVSNRKHEHNSICSVLIDLGSFADPDDGELTEAAVDRIIEISRQGNGICWLRYSAPTEGSTRAFLRLVQKANISDDADLAIARKQGHDVEFDGWLARGATQVEDQQGQIWCRFVGVQRRRSAFCSRIGGVSIHLSNRNDHFQLVANAAHSGAQLSQIDQFPFS